jgi:hypothetical protein
MKKISIFFSMLVASLLMSALPAFSSGTGPFGSFGPDISYGMNPGIDSQHIAFSSGTGPYGTYGPVISNGMNPGVERHIAFSGGTGPYGAFGSYGMVNGVESHQFASKDECLLVAKNCPPDIASVQYRIDRLNTEIAKGTDVYTPSELKVLHDKLDAAYEELNNANMNKGY